MTREINGLNCILGGSGDFRVAILDEWAQGRHNSWVSNAPENTDDHRKMPAFVKRFLEERFGPLPGLDEEHTGYATNVLVFGVEGMDQRAASHIKTRDTPDRFRNKQLRYFCDVHRLFMRSALV